MCSKSLFKNQQKKSKIILFLILLIFPLISSAQKIRKKEFFKEELGFDEAWDNIKDGNDLFEEGVIHHKKALDFYLKANTYNLENAELNYKIGVCYLNSTNRSSAIKFLEKAFSLKPDVSEKIQYYIGRAYHLSLNFDKAIEYYQIYKKELIGEDSEQKQRQIDKLIKECSSGKELFKLPARVFIENLGEKINTEYDDYAPFTTKKDSVLIYTSRRISPETEKINNLDNLFYENIYISKKDSAENWTEGEYFKKLNKQANTAIIGFSPDGSQIYTYSGKRNGDILVSSYKKNKWKSPKRLPKQINTSKYHENSASITEDGKTLFFISNNKKSTFGGHDIYYSKLNEKGKWSEATHLSAAINTPYEEICIWTSPNGNTLYFASNGHNTLGGYDIFKSEKDKNGIWKKAENLGFPINTPADELFFSMFSEDLAYYSSNRDNGKGRRDIYKIEFLGEEKPSYQNTEDDLMASIIRPITHPEMLPEITGIKLIGKISNTKTRKPVKAAIEIIDNKTSEIVASTMSESNGNYSLLLPPGRNYAISAKAKDYMFYSENIDVQKDVKYQVLKTNIELTKIEIGAKVILKNIFFDSGETTLRSESFSELDRLIRFMEQNPSIRIEISGHTDNKGGYSANRNLSEKRAKVVSNYLKAKKVKPSRIHSKGYWYRFPIASNNTEEGRQQNRRVEFKIIGK